MLKDFSNVIQEWRNNSPRVNELSSKFLSIAIGQSGAPLSTPLDEKDLISWFKNDKFVLDFYYRCKLNFGKFGLHFISSIPYALQEWCRLGSALDIYLSRIQWELKRDVYFQSIGSAEGVIARTLAEQGYYTLTNSSTSENEIEFFKNRRSKTACFYAGPYFDISPDLLRNNLGLKKFADGFDVIFEDTCFQMHAPNRAEQVAWVCQNLREDGLFICWEKCILEDQEEYLRREQIKDNKFKARYFSTEQVIDKKNTILQRMEKGQVTLEALIKGISTALKHIAIIWNSGNFYTLVASNDINKIEDFCKCMLEPCIPAEFLHLELPKMMSDPSIKLSFRQPIV